MHWHLLGGAFFFYESQQSPALPEQKRYFSMAWLVVVLFILFHKHDILEEAIMVLQSFHPREVVENISKA